MKVREEQHIPSENAQNSLTQIDFIDTFSTTNHTDSIPEIAKMIFGQSPKWVRSLFGIRNFLVRFIGLKNNAPKDYVSGLDVGIYIGFFKIFTIKNDEMILGANDSHLNFRAVIQNTHSPSYNIKVTTLVAYNNRKGRVYMTLIKPFHRIVVKNMVKQAYKNNIGV